jgi:pyruvate kinase
VPALVDPTTAAAVDAASLMTKQLDAGLIVVAADSGRPARALSNRRPAATILAVPQTEQVARRLSLCWGVTAVVLPQPSWAEHVLAFGIDWAKSHGLVRAGQHAVLLRGQIAEKPHISEVLAGVVN